MEFNNIKVLHIITDLGLGGAETMLYKIIANSPDPKKHSVISLRSKGFFGDKIEELGANVYPLGMTKNPFFLNPFKVIKLIKEISPDAIQCWMFHANLFGSIFGRLAGIKNIAWGIHHSISKNDKCSIRIINKILAFISHNFCKTVICCGTKPSKICKDSGYDKEKILCIYNGFDISSMNFNAKWRDEIREELGLKNFHFVIVHVARYHYLKNHIGLLRIFANLLKINKDAKLLLVGDGIKDRKEIEETIDALNIRKSIQILGMRSDVNKIYSAADVSILTSLAEGFPNVIGESMLCKCPCVSSDVGDCGFIIGNPNFVIDLNNEDGFVKILNDIANLSSDEQVNLREHSRNRIVENFDIKKIYAQYNDAWNKKSK